MLIDYCSYVFDKDLRKKIAEAKKVSPSGKEEQSTKANSVLSSKQPSQSNIVTKNEPANNTTTVQKVDQTTQTT